MKGSIRISFALALSLLSLLANAQETERQYTISAGILNYYFNSDKALDDNMGFQIGFEMPLVDR